MVPCWRALGWRERDHVPRTGDQLAVLAIENGRPMEQRSRRRCATVGFRQSFRGFLLTDGASVGMALDADVVDGVFPCFCFLSGRTFRPVRNLVLDRVNGTFFGQQYAQVLLLWTDTGSPLFVSPGALDSPILPRSLLFFVEEISMIFREALIRDALHPDDQW